MYNKIIKYINYFRTLYLFGTLVILNMRCSNNSSSQMKKSTDLIKNPKNIEKNCNEEEKTIEELRVYKTKLGEYGDKMQMTGYLESVFEGHYRKICNENIPHVIFSLIFSYFFHLDLQFDIKFDSFVKHIYNLEEATREKILKKQEKNHELGMKNLDRNRLIFKDCTPTEFIAQHLFKESQIIKILPSTVLKFISNYNEYFNLQTHINFVQYFEIYKKIQNLYKFIWDELGFYNLDRTFSYDKGAKAIEKAIDFLESKCSYYITLLLEYVKRERKRNERKDLNLKLLYIQLVIAIKTGHNMSSYFFNDKKLMGNRYPFSLNSKNDIKIKQLVEDILKVETTPNYQLLSSEHVYNFLKDNKKLIYKKSNERKKCYKCIKGLYLNTWPECSLKSSYFKELEKFYNINKYQKDEYTRSRIRFINRDIRRNEITPYAFHNWWRLDFKTHRLFECLSAIYRIQNPCIVQQNRWSSCVPKVDKDGNLKVNYTCDYSDYLKYYNLRYLLFHQFNYIKDNQTFKQLYNRILVKNCNTLFKYIPETYKYLKRLREKIDISDSSNERNSSENLSNVLSDFDVTNIDLSIDSTDLYMILHGLHMGFVEKEITDIICKEFLPFEFTYKEKVYTNKFFTKPVVYLDEGSKCLNSIVLSNVLMYFYKQDPMLLHYIFANLYSDDMTECVKYYFFWYYSESVLKGNIDDVKFFNSIKPKIEKEKQNDWKVECKKWIKDFRDKINKATSNLFKVKTKNIYYPTFSKKNNFFEIKKKAKTYKHIITKDSNFIEERSLKDEDSEEINQEYYSVFLNSTPYRSNNSKDKITPLINRTEDRLNILFLDNDFIKITLKLDSCVSSIFNFKFKQNCIFVNNVEAFLKNNKNSYNAEDMEKIINEFKKYLKIKAQYTLILFMYSYDIMLDKKNMYHYPSKIEFDALKYEQLKTYFDTAKEKEFNEEEKKQFKNHKKIIEKLIKTDKNLNCMPTKHKLSYSKYQVKFV